MKQAVCWVLALLLVLGLSVPVLAQEEAETEACVYVSDAGDDGAAGTKDAPKKTLEGAYALLGEHGGRVVLAGNLTVSGEYRALCAGGKTVGAVTISAEEGAVLTVTDQGIWFPGDTKLENLSMHFTYGDFYGLLVANCHRFEVGEGVTVTISDSAYGYPAIYGGGYYSQTWMIPEKGFSDVIVRSGRWSQVFGAGATHHADWGLVDDVPVDVRVLIAGGKIESVYGGGNGTVGNDGLPTTVAGNVSVEVTGGEVKHIVANGLSTGATITGNATVRVTGGDVEDIKVNLFGEDDAVGGETELIAPPAYAALASGFGKVTLLEGENPDEPTVHPKRDIVYLSGAGSDRNDGSPEHPVETLLAAYNLLKETGGKIVVTADARVEGEYRALCGKDAEGTPTELLGKIGPVVLTAENGAKLTVVGQGIWFPSETVIENIALHFTYTAANAYLVANGYRFTIGENVTVTVGEGAQYPIIYGGGMYSFLWIPEGTSSEVTVKSGTWAAVFGGGAANGRGWGTHIDDVKDTHVTVEGGKIETVYGAGNGTVGGTDPVAVKGNVTLDIKGGEIGAVVGNGAGGNAPVEGNVTINITGGTIGEIRMTRLGNRNFVSGTVTLNCNDSYRKLANGFESGSEEKPPEQVTTGNGGEDSKPQDTGASREPADSKDPKGSATASSDDKSTAGCASSLGSGLLPLLLFGGAFAIGRKRKRSR